MAVTPAGSPSTPATGEPLTASPVLPEKDASGVSAFNDDDGPDFSDLLDIINPLQHIPIISTIYHHLTGDTEGAVAEVVGGTIYGALLGGGILGLIGSLINVAVEDSSGKGLDEHVLALFNDETANTAVADTSSPSPSTDAESDAALVPSRETVTPDTLRSPSGTQATSGEPVRAGDYLIFGGLAASASVSRLSGASATGRGSTTTRSNVATPEAGPARQGDFLIFGADATPAARSLPQAPTSVTGESTTASAPEAPAPVAAAGAAKFFPAPQRGGGSRATATLSMPTTGRGAVSGTRGQSEAILRPNTLSSGQEISARGDSPAAARGPDEGAARTDSPGANDGGTGAGSPWFATMFNQAMDKYERASHLGARDAAPTAAGY